MLLTCYPDSRLAVIMSNSHSIVRITFLMFLILLTFLLIEVPLGLRPVQATTRGFNLLGFISGWNSSTTSNPTIIVLQGDSVTINAKTGDGATHQWFLDVNNDGTAECSPGPDICGSFFSTSNAPPLTFQAGFAPNAYTLTYFCSVHPGTMHGQFTVKQLLVGGDRYAD